MVIHRGTTRYEGGSAIGSGTIFDLASLTKPLATALLLLTQVREGAVGPDDPIGRFFVPAGTDKAGITLRDLLGHCSGLAAHRPFFQWLTDIPQEERAERVAEMIMDDPLLYPRGSQAIYSDLGFLLLGLVAEQVGGQTLDILFEERIAAPLGLSGSLFFNRLGAARPGTYAATEFCPWRGRVLAGEVSDENCFALGGVAGHAGLFGTTTAVLALVETIHDLWMGEPTPLAIDPADVRHFFTRQPTPGSTWALGFDTPSAAGSTSGRFFSSRSVGHLGFTGTSFWIDPEQHAMVVLLTNRVHPSRENNRIKAFRPALHDAVMRALGLAPQ
ncbi:MAG: serine hydrolase [Thermodesulfobacteriota bacterium]